jgi:hypothetical protein
MKIVAGAHPDLPLPFSNGPEVPPEPLRGLPEPLRLASERYEEGLVRMATLMNLWLTRGNLSHEQMVAICAWGLGEVVLDKAVISRLRNARQARGASLRHIDALAAGNRAIWLWQTKGQAKAWAELGPHVGWGVRDEWLNSTIWLPSGDNSREPLGFLELAELVVGYADLPYLSSRMLSPIEATRLSQRLAALLDQEIAERGWGVRQGIEQLLQAYPVTDPARCRRLKELIVGDQSLARDDIEAELAALAEMLRVVRGLKAGSYGPAELEAELLGPRPRS